MTDEYAEWELGLSDSEAEDVASAVIALSELGPALRRPFVGQIAGSRFAHMKELIPPSGNIRILFAFDPRRTAILLLGGDKTGQWNKWYEYAIPKADELYEIYLGELQREGLLP
jgi:hypothetical protein